MKKNYKKLLCLALVMLVIIGSMSAFAYTGWQELLGGAGISIYFGDKTGNGTPSSTSTVCYGTAFANSISSDNLVFTLYSNGVYRTSTTCYNNAAWNRLSYVAGAYHTWRAELRTYYGGTGGYGYGSIGSTGYVY